jgi:hypothetical protein
VVESIKHEVRKYVIRERKKPLPADFDVWDFSCKVGASLESAESKNLRDIGSAIDAVVNAGGSSVYVELISMPSRRTVVGRVTTPEAVPEPPRDSAGD